VLKYDSGSDMRRVHKMAKTKTAHLVIAHSTTALIKTQRKIDCKQSTRKGNSRRIVVRFCVVQKRKFEIKNAANVNDVIGSS
jgi:hypothetical protein